MSPSLIQNNGLSPIVTFSVDSVNSKQCDDQHFFNKANYFFNTPIFDMKNVPLNKNSFGVQNLYSLLLFLLCVMLEILLLNNLSLFILWFTENRLSEGSGRVVLMYTNPLELLGEEGNHRKLIKGITTSRVFPFRLQFAFTKQSLSFLQKSTFCFNIHTYKCIWIHSIYTYIDVYYLNPLHYIPP